MSEEQVKAKAYIEIFYSYAFKDEKHLDELEKQLAPLRPSGWQNTLLKNLQPLPRNGKPVTLWNKRDLAFEDIVEGLREIIYAPTKMMFLLLCGSKDLGISMRSWVPN